MSNWFTDAAKAKNAFAFFQYASLLPCISRLQAIALICPCAYSCLTGGAPNTSISWLLV